jgi:hypothetical protein
MHSVIEFVAKLAVSAVLAVVVGLLDGPLFDVEMPWWVCAAIGLVIVFGGLLIIDRADDW